MAVGVGVEVGVAVRVTTALLLIVPIAKTKISSDRLWSWTPPTLPLVAPVKGFIDSIGNKIQLFSDQRAVVSDKMTLFF